MGKPDLKTAPSKFYSRCPKTWAPPVALAPTLVETAHQIRPYSNATRNNVDVQLTIV